MCVSSKSRQHAIRCKKIVNIKSSSKWPWLKTYKITKRLISVTTDLRLCDIFFQFIEKKYYAFTLEIQFIACKPHVATKLIIKWAIRDDLLETFYST
jgi:hypothetical protein